MGLDESVLDRHGAGADMVPSGEVFAVEELDPAVGLGEERESEE